ncbi:Small subunit (SSU) processome component [Serendipita sp. 399]|nr:Small subunit (SSU) processome component [Serendipita sp. 399]
MATISKKQKKAAQNVANARKINTSSLSQPVNADAAPLASLNAFSPNHQWFAFLSLAVDKHRLRVFDTTTGVSIAEYTLQVSSVTSLQWGTLATDSGKTVQSKKRKRSTQDSGPKAAPGTPLVLLGLENGGIVFFSPTQGSAILTLSHPSATRAVLDVKTDLDEQRVWTTSEDGVIRLWDAKTSHIICSWTSESKLPYSRLAIRTRNPLESSSTQHVLAANHSIDYLELQLDSLDEEAVKATRLSTFSGHVTDLLSLQWISSSSDLRFITTAERDRFLQGWNVPKRGEGRIAFSASADGDIRKAHISQDGNYVLALSSSGLISIFKTPPATSTVTTPLEAESVVGILVSKDKKTSEPAQILDACFVSDQQGTLRVTRLLDGARLVFHVVRFTDDQGAVLPEVQIKVTDPKLGQGLDAIITSRRYKENDGKVASAIQISHGEVNDDEITPAVHGVLDTEMAELSLGQRLRAMNGVEGSSSDSSDSGAKRRKQKSGKKVIEVPPESLSRTLIQALHSSDTRLLEGCLRYSEPKIIKNTVKRLPPQLTVPLLQACVDRLARGRGGNRGPASGAAASSQRGMAMVAWIRAVLVAHSGYLMTIPNLVPRLSSLHATLTARLSLQGRLLALNGRLDFALSQVEMRSGKTTAQLAAKSERIPKDKDEGVTRYVEGDSSDEQEDSMGEVEVERGSEAGSIEDIGLRGKALSDTDSESAGEEDEDDEDEGEEDEDGEEEDEDDEDEDEDDSEESGNEPALNGFIDDEAEESWGSESEEDDEEDD